MAYFRNLIFICVQKVCLFVFKKPKQKISKLVEYELKYEEFWPVFLLNASSCDKCVKLYLIIIS